MTEAELREANGLVTRFYRSKVFDEKVILQTRLFHLGVALDTPLNVPDPHAPAGGSAAALKAA